MANEPVIVSNERAEELVSILKGIAHPLRLRILAVLCQQDCTVTEFTELLDARQSQVSQHLAPLRMLNLVSVDRTGGHATYSLAEPKLRNLLDCLMSCREDHQ